LFIGSIGVDPNTNSDRFTMGWDYLADGVQLMTFVAGLFAIPEMLEGFAKGQLSTVKPKDNYTQTKQGALAVWRYKWDALRGGFIGAFIGLLPGLGGAMSDWMSYGSTVAAHPDKKFGTGEIVGVIGPEGSNNAQKATSMIPTVLFGIPGASFAAVLMALFMYLGFELGTPDLVYDTRFFSSLTYGFMWATILVGFICIIFTPYISRIAYVPYRYYFPVLLVFIVWSCVQYTGGWEDYAMLVICSILGIVAKRIKFSRAAILVAFILAERIENLTIQTFTLYNVETLTTRPIFITIILISIGCLVYGISNKNKLEYS
jgi:TctA family transporter